jgi:anti-sigma B factor antagonist
MRLDNSMRGDVVVVTLRDTRDGPTMSAAKASLDRAMRGHHRTVLLDLSEMPYVSSTGLRVLLLAHRCARAADARLALACPPSDVREVMAATGFLEFLTVFDALDTAVAALT